MQRFMRLMAVSTVMLLTLAGCKTSTPTPSDLAVAQLAGTGAAAVWVVAAQPTLAQEAQVASVLDTITVYSAAIGTNTSYVAFVYPQVQTYVANNTSIQPQDKAVILAGSMALLQGIDLMFQANPQWRTDAAGTSAYINAFVAGAKSALALPATSPKNMSSAAAYKATMPKRSCHD